MITHEITQQDSSQLELNIRLDAESLEPYRQAALDRLKVSLKVPGFRPGKAPNAVAERHLDSTQIQSEVFEAAIGESYDQTLRELSIEAIAQPRVVLTKFVPYTELEYKATVAIAPTIKFDYSRLRVKPKPFKLDEIEIAKTLDSLRGQTATRKPVKRAAKDGDELRLDFEGIREGKPVEGAAAQNQTIQIGSGQFIPGFEENLVGLKAGEEKTFTVTFPKDYGQSDLAGKKVEFRVKVHEVKEVTLPELNDAFAKSTGPFKNLDDLHEDIRLKLTDAGAAQERKDYEQAVLKELLKRIKLNIPAVLVDEQVHDLEHEVEEKLKTSGLTVEQYLALQKKSRESFEDELRTEASNRIQTALIVRDIIRKQKLDVSVDEVESEIAKLRTSYTDPKMLAELDHDHFRTDLYNHLLSSKAMEYLITTAKGAKS